MLTVPVSTRAASRRPRATSRVQMLALSPYVESLARATAYAASTSSGVESGSSARGSPVDGTRVVTDCPDVASTPIQAGELRRCAAAWSELPAGSQVLTGPGSTRPPPSPATSAGADVSAAAAP